MTMLEYVKMILEKVSFDKKLFEKELMKGIKELIPDDVKELQSWCYARFGNIYQNILNRIFRKPQFGLA